MANKKVKWTYELVKEYVESLGYELVSEEYINIDERLCFKDSEGYYYTMSFYGLYNKNNPQKFHPKNPYTIQNIKLFIDRNNLNFNVLSDNYKTTKENIILQDNEGFKYEITLSSLLINCIPRRYDKSNSYTLYNIKLWLKNNTPEFHLITKEYVNKKNKIVLQDHEGYYYFVLWESFIKNRRSNKFYIENPYTIENIKLWCKLNNKTFELINGQEYKGNDIKIKWKCLKDGCGEIFEMDWEHIYAGQGCSFCAGKQLGLSNCLAIKNPELAKEWHIIKNGILTPFSVFPNANQKVWWTCKECGFEWFARIASRNQGNGCPLCNESKGEKQLDYILTKYNFYHDKQYEFNDLKGIGNGLLRFDTPVFWDQGKTNLRLLIEYDGEQHFKWIKGMMTKKKFETLKIHDEMKNEYCLKHNIKLIRIPYWDFDNIEEIIIKELNLNDIKIAI